ncbi:MAG: MotE family protein [Amphiplicatus sp.]
MRPSPLVVIAIIFAASFSGRAVSFASAAASSLEKPVAQKPVEDKAAPPKAAEAKQPAPDHAGETSAQPARNARAEPSDETGLDRDRLLAAIRERAAALDKREESVMARARALEAVEQRIEQKTAELKTIKAELESRLSFAETAAQDDIARLAKMYENMKPQKAGEIFNAMDPTFAAGFLTEMNNESAALILANMETEKAYAASVIIAGRNASVNKR